MDQFIVIQPRRTTTLNQQMVMMHNDVKSYPLFQQLFFTLLLAFHLVMLLFNTDHPNVFDVEY
jgi:hypothetical protein